MKLQRTLRGLHQSCNPTCISSSCKRGDCALVTQGLKVEIVDCDKCQAFSQDETRPDFVLLFIENKTVLSRWFIIDMKGRVSNIGHIVKQLQAGANAIQFDSHFQVGTSSFSLFPLILHDGHVRTADFSKRFILFQGHKRLINIKRCNMHLKFLL